MNAELEDLLAQLPTDPEPADTAVIRMGDAKPDLLPIAINAALELGWQWTTIREGRVRFFYGGNKEDEIQFHID